jgi:hypothetical protein
VKIVDTRRWPKALYSALSIAAGVIPSRLAVVRSNETYACNPLSERSLATSVICGTSFSRSTSVCTHFASSIASVSSTVNWYCVRDTRASIVRSCTGCM